MKPYGPGRLGRPPRPRAKGLIIIKGLEGTFKGLWPWKVLEGPGRPWMALYKTLTGPWKALESPYRVLKRPSSVWQL